MPKCYNARCRIYVLCQEDTQDDGGQYTIYEGPCHFVLRITTQRFGEVLGTPFQVQRMSQALIPLIISTDLNDANVNVEYGGRTFYLRVTGIEHSRILCETKLTLDTRQF